MDNLPARAVTRSHRDFGFEYIIFMSDEKKNEELWVKTWDIQVKRISLENSYKGTKSERRRISKDLGEDAYCFNSRGGEWWSDF